ncbi:MAG: hypothetical protein ACFFD2_07605 [Promethearchaeota archaeon]
MGSRTVKIVGAIIGLVGMVWAIVRLYPALGIMFTWIFSSESEKILAGWLLIIILIAWIVSIIGIALGFVTKRSGGGVIIVSGLLFLAVWLFMFFGPYTQTALTETVYNFIDTSLNGSWGWIFPLEAILFLAGGIIVFAGRVS